MALIKSSLLSDISGSIGGTTYARARGGLYARNRTTPINPRTVHQEANRSIFGDIAGAYSNLDWSEIEAWRTYAEGFPVLNRFGDTYHPSGRQVFMMLNRNLAILGVPAITTPPPITDVPTFDITKFSYSFAATGGVLTELEVTDTAAQAIGQSGQYQLAMTPPVIAARGQSYRNQMRTGPWNGAFAAATDLITSYENFFADGDTIPAVDGQRINVGVRLINEDYGLASAWLYTNVKIDF